MKTNNYKTVRIYFIFLFTAAIMTIFWIYLWLGNFPLLLFPFAILLLLLLKIINLKYFSFENSGEVISIRYYNPIFQTLKVHSEFPLNKIHHIKMERLFFKDVLVFGLKKEGTRKIIHLYYNTSGLSKKKLKAIKTSIHQYDSRL